MSDTKCCIFKYLCVDDETNNGRSDKAANAAHTIGHSHHAARVVRRNVNVIHLRDPPMDYKVQTYIVN